MNAAAEFAWGSQAPKTELGLLFEHAPFGLAQCRRGGEIATFNPALERMLGGGLKTARVPRLSDLLPAPDRAKADCLLGELFEGERDDFQMDCSSNGSNELAIRWRAWRVSGTDGRPDYALASAEVVENPVAAHHRHQAGLETMGRLAGGVAHDFNNLLTGVLLYCDLLMASLESGHRLWKYAEEIRNAGMQATGLIRQLLAIARPTNGEPGLVSLNEIAEEMRSLLLPLIGENIDLQFRLDPNLGLIKMDPTQAQQLLLNLVLNARDAMPGGGRVTVETSNCKVHVLTEAPCGVGTATIPCALFIVADNGSGMDAATRAQIFEAFFTTKINGKGTGLGLATVHDIVTANGGLIHVDSAPACGTRVSVLLPLVPEAVLQSQRAFSVTEISQKPNDPLPETIEGVLPAGEKE